jgi:hypothetical protein
MDRKILGLGIALAYPQYAFAAEAPLVIAQGRNLVERAGRGELVEAEVTGLLSCHPRLNEWIAQLLEDRDLLPPHLQRDEVRSFDPLPGPVSPVGASRYVCPSGDGFTWHKMSVAETVPSCPFCSQTLTRA